MLFDVAACSHVGLKKDKNEDSYGVFGDDTPGLSLFKEGMLLVVADGLGGHIGGDIASKLGVSMLKDILKEPPPADNIRGSEKEEEYYADLMRSAIRRANESIFRTNMDLVKGGRPMGTTVVSALIQPGVAYIGNVGDSRAYLYRAGKFIARTEDHSWVEEQVKQGAMTKTEAESDKRRHLLTRSIGTHPDITVDLYKWRLQPGDVLLLCSDGLSNMIPDQELMYIMGQSITAQEIVNQMVDLANRNGGRDNITAILAIIAPPRSALNYRRFRAWLKNTTDGIVKGGKLLLFGITCFLAGYIVKSLFS